jgi:hypothetical protein
MLEVTDELLQRTISLLGEGDRRDAEIVVGVARIAPDQLTARRLIDWIPEAFAMVLLPHVGDLTLPTSFSAKAADGTWKTFPFEREPIFGRAVKIAEQMHREDPRGTFSAVARRGTLLKAVNDVLNAGRSVTGTTIAGPAFADLPAEFYDPKPKSASFWRKLVG